MKIARIPSLTPSSTRSRLGKISLQGILLLCLASPAILTGCSADFNRNIASRKGTTTLTEVPTSSALAAVPSAKDIAAGSQFQFASSGGVAPYTYAMASGRGSIDPSTGIYIAPPNQVRADPSDPAEFARIQVTDSTGATAISEIRIFPPLQISPATITVVQSSTRTFTASGGIEPYAFSVLSGQGSIHSSTGVFTAPAAPGTTFIRVRDAGGNETAAVVTITPPFGGNTSNVLLPVTNTYALIPSGGSPPYSFAITSVPAYGTITSATGMTSAYVAPATVPPTSVVEISITDSLSQTDQVLLDIQPALQISPASKYVAYNGSFPFGVSGGVGPYTFSLSSPSASGSVTSGGVFTATSTAGSVGITVTDSRGNSSTAIAHVYPPVQIAPTRLDIAKNAAAVSFSATGGDASSPYTYSLTGVGTINATTGAYTPGTIAGTAVITVTDAAGNTSSANVRVYTPLSVPASITLAYGNSYTITPSSGLAPFQFTIDSSTGGANGTLSAASGASSVFTAGSASAGVVKVRVTDDTYPSPQSYLIDFIVNPPLEITPNTRTLAVNNSYAFNVVSGTGVPPYSWAVVGGAANGSVSASGNYTAPATPGTYTVRVSDSHSTPNTSDATVTVVPALSLVASSANIDLRASSTLTVSGGVPPYVFSKTSGPGTLSTLSATTAMLTAQNTPGVAAIQVTDSVGSTPFGTASVTIDMPDPITVPSGSYTLSAGDTQTIVPSGGVPQYDGGASYGFAFSGACGSGTLSPSSGLSTVFTAGADGSCTMLVSDGVSSNVPVVFNVVPLIQIAPTSWTMAINQSKTFSVVGGTGISPFTYSVVSGGGSIGPSDGLYSSAGATPGTPVTVRVTDARSHTSDAVITVNAGLNVTPATATLNSITSPNQTFTVSGGVGPYTFSFTGTGGTASPLGVTSSTTFYSHPMGGTAQLTVTDSASGSATIPITIVVPAPSSAPTVTIGTVTPHSVQVSWSAVTMTNSNGSAPVDGYEIRVDGGTWMQVSNSTTSYNFTGLTANASHTVEVRAFTTSGGAGPAGSATQRICDIDYVLNSGAGTCDDCSLGKYSSGGAVTTCNSCANPIPNSASITWAPPRGCTISDFSCATGYGKYPANPDATKCTQCGVGATSNGTVACATCTTPSNGLYFTTAGSCATGACTNTSTGQYWTSAGGTSPTGCSNAACTNTTAGFYWTSHGGTSASGCTNAACTNTPSIGQYWSSHGGTSATGCALGACTNTPIGQYWTTNGGNSATGCTNAACTNILAGKYWTSHGGTSATGCVNGNCTNTPAVGQYWSGHGGTSATGCAVAACTNAFPGQYWTSNGGTSATGCGVAACTNVLAIGQYWTSHGGTSATGCTTGECTNKPVGQYFTTNGGANATGCTNAACTNTTPGSYFTSHGGTSATGCTNAACTNTPAVGQYWSGHGGTTATGCAVAACTNTPAGQYWTSHGGTSATGCTNAACTNILSIGRYWSGHGGTSATGCASAECTNKPVGQYFTSTGGTNPTGCTNAACTNTPAGQYWTSHGGTSAIGCTNAACTNTPAIGQYWSGHGGTTATGCAVAACTNTTPGEYWTSHGGTSATGCATAACTNILAIGKYWTSHGGTSSTGCTSGNCTNTPVGQYFTSNGGASATGCTNAACTNTPAGQYWTSHGGTSATGCTNAACTNTPANGQYWSGHGGTSATGCPVSACTNVLGNGNYYSSNGGTNPTGCIVSTCTNTPAAGQAWTSNGGSNPTGCTIGACTNTPPVGMYWSGHGGGFPNACPQSGCTNVYNGQYFTSNGGTNPTGCGTATCTNTPAAGQYWSGHGGTNPSGCPIGTCSNTPAVGQYWTGHGGGSATGCPIGSCTNAPARASYTGNGGTSNNCPWACNSGYSQFPGYENQCLLCQPGDTRMNGMCGPSTNRGPYVETCMPDGLSWGNGFCDNAAI